MEPKISFLSEKTICIQDTKLTPSEEPRTARREYEIEARNFEPLTADHFTILNGKALQVPNSHPSTHWPDNAGEDLEVDLISAPKFCHEILMMP